MKKYYFTDDDISVIMQSLKLLETQSNGSAKTVASLIMDYMKKWGINCDDVYELSLYGVQARLLKKIMTAVHDNSKYLSDIFDTVDMPQELVQLCSAQILMMLNNVESN